MMMLRCWRICGLLSVLVLAACASRPVLPTVDSACLQQFARLDQQLAQQGLHDGGSYHLPGYPYLRLNRLMASFTYELDSEAKRQTWLHGLRAEDQRARSIELRNLGVTDAASIEQQLQSCGQRLVDNLLANEQKFAAVRDVAQVPDEYSLLARTLGLYPFAVPFLRLGISQYHDRIQQDYAGPLTTPEGARLWRWAPDAGSSGADHSIVFRYDSLGIPSLDDAGWARLLRKHAPVWEVEVLSADDHPGAVIRKNGEVQIDPSKVRTYTRVSYTRFEGQVLPQLVYSFWFPRRSQSRLLDPYAGEFDAVIWRVTLDQNGQPLIYDSIHGCGCYHYFFPVQSLALRGPGSFWDEPVMLPQAAVPAGPVVIRLAAGTHYIRRVRARDNAPSAGVELSTYHLAAASGLLSLPGPEGQRSLYDEAGMLRGSERLERFWLWPSGVRNPGAMRQWGRHATAFVGRRHFDAPDLLDRLFYRP